MKYMRNSIVVYKGAGGVKEDNTVIPVYIAHSIHTILKITDSVGVTKQSVTR